jgi:hypothetical protein
MAQLKHMDASASGISKGASWVNTRLGQASVALQMPFSHCFGSQAW